MYKPLYSFNLTKHLRKLFEKKIEKSCQAMTFIPYCSAMWASVIELVTCDFFFFCHMSVDSPCRQLTKQSLLRWGFEMISCCCQLSSVTLNQRKGLLPSCWKTRSCCALNSVMGVSTHLTSHCSHGWLKTQVSVCTRNLWPHVCWEEYDGEKWSESQENKRPPLFVVVVQYLFRQPKAVVFPIQFN